MAATQTILELRQDAYNLLQEEGLDATLVTVTTTPIPASGKVATTTTNTAVKALPFSVKQLPPGDTGRDEVAITMLAAQGLSAPPKSGDKLTVGAKTWVIDKVTPYPDDGAADASGVAVFELECPR